MLNVPRGFALMVISAAVIVQSKILSIFGVMLGISRAVLPLRQQDLNLLRLSHERYLMALFTILESEYGPREILLKVSL